MACCIDIFATSLTEPILYFYYIHLTYALVIRRKFEHKLNKTETSDGLNGPIIEFGLSSSFRQEALSLLACHKWQNPYTVTSIILLCLVLHDIYIYRYIYDHIIDMD